MLNLPATSPRTTQADQSLDEVTVHCAICRQTTATFAVLLLGDYSERNAWKAVEEKAKLAGWEMRVHVPLDSIEPHAEWVCPICFQREKIPMTFPSFTGKKPCTKCGGKEIVTKYERGPHEHMRRACTECGFEWNEAMQSAPWWRRILGLA